MSAPPNPPALTVPPPPPTATMRGSALPPAFTPSAGAAAAVGRSDRFAAAKTAPLNSALSPSTQSSSLQRPSTVPVSIPNPEDLGVKFADTGKSNITDEDRANWKTFRVKVANEVFTTERSYVQSLAMMLKAYHDPYIDGQKTGLTEKKVAALFTLNKVILTVANSFLAEVEVMCQNWDRDEIIAPTFIKFCPMFRTYRDYSSIHQQQILTILSKINSRSAFTSFQEKQIRSLQCLDLASYLIMPIQRLPRYKMLLEALISKTESTHPQAPQLLIALKNISEVASSVNEAMKNAQLVELYMHVQRIFGSQEELVHLWRKLLQEFPCKITRIWSPSLPQRDANTPKDKEAKEKKEKKHKFVGSDASVFLFTDCVWVGIKTKDRLQKYEETKTSLTPYPLYAQEFSYKFSLLTLGVHSLSTSTLPSPITVNDHTYHNSLVLSSPIHAICLTFDTTAAKDAAEKLLTSTMREFETICRTRTLKDSKFFDSPPNGKTNELLCCDKCQNGLFLYQKIGAELGGYNLNHNHVICNRCEGIVCVQCLHEDPMFEKAAQGRTPPTPGAVGVGGFGFSSTTTPSSGSAMFSNAKSPSKLNQILGGNSRILAYPSNTPTHTSEGFGVCPATGRWCRSCQAHPPSIISEGKSGNLNTIHNQFDYANDRDSLRKSYISPTGPGATLTADDLKSIRARQNKTDLGLRISTMNHDEGRDPLALPTPSSRSGNENPIPPQDIPPTPSTNSDRHSDQSQRENSKSKPPESPISATKPPVFNTLGSSSLSSGPPPPINTQPSSSPPPITAQASSPSPQITAQPSSPPPFTPATSAVLPPPAPGGGPPPFTARSSVLPPPFVPSSTSAVAVPPVPPSSGPPPPPPGSNTPQSKTQLPPLPALPPMKIDDDEDCPPPPPTVGEPVQFDPTFRPLASPVSCIVPPPPDDEEEDVAPPPPPTPKMQQPQQPIPQQPRSNALAPKQVRRPSI